jgi:DNA-binding MarR family transcriptional regulator
MEKAKPEYSPSAEERRKYVLATPLDLEILAKCRELKEKKLGQCEMEMVALIETQLKREWREELISKLNQLLKKINEKKT